MVYFKIFASCIVLLADALAIVIILSTKYLWAERIYCFLYYHKKYKIYKEIINYNKVIPIYNDETTYNKELMGNRYYIMNGDLYFGAERLCLKRMPLMMNDIINRNYIKLT